MAQKPTFASVTDEPCTCAFLHDCAEEPSNPIVFDEKTSEFHVKLGKGAYLLVHHCPFCGGVAPRSKRPALFATVTAAEEERLLALTSGLKSIADVIAALGPPDLYLPQGVVDRIPGRGDEPASVTTHRTLTYEKLSETVDIRITDHGLAGVRISLSGKYVGKK